jgi:AcrR family transcriptional regulator
MEANKKVRTLIKKSTTHKKIMHTAKALFEKKGIGNVTVLDICKMTEICRSTFFNHFPTIEALLIGIADEEINDLITVSKEYKGINIIIEMINKLIDDTIPYPTLTTQFMVSSILKSKGENSFKEIEKIIKDVIEQIKINQKYTSDEKVSLIIGGYYGLVFSKFINNISFNDSDELKITMKKLISDII